MSPVSEQWREETMSQSCQEVCQDGQQCEQLAIDLGQLKILKALDQWKALDQCLEAKD